MTPTDRLLAAYIAFVTGVIAARGGAGGATVWLIAAHLQFAALLWLFTRLRATERIGHVLHDLYPLILLGGLYAEIGLISSAIGAESIFAHDSLVQRWETALFGMQVSYEWIRRAPSVFWSAVLHLAYLFYYPIIILGPVLLVARRQGERARRVLFSTMLAFVVCYAVFVLYPVAGPNYAFPHPDGAVREVWSARLVYGMLSLGSSFGAAFPSSHVAATVAAVAVLWQEWRALALACAIPALLLVVGTVYCQMHYGVDVLAGLVVAGVAAAVGRRLRHV